MRTLPSSFRIFSETDNYFEVCRVVKGLSIKINTRKEADAHLIAAAPDLLHALKQMLHDRPADAEDLVRIAEAAIAKAEGRVI
jgi:F420-0:gamma-glutamyl ligase